MSLFSRCTLQCKAAVWPFQCKLSCPASTGITNQTSNYCHCERLSQQKGEAGITMKGRFFLWDKKSKHTLTFHFSEKASLLAMCCFTQGTPPAPGLLYSFPFFLTFPRFTGRKWSSSVTMWNKDPLITQGYPNSSRLSHLSSMLQKYKKNTTKCFCQLCHITYYF